MASPTYQEIKLAILEAVPLTRDAVHIYVGFAALFAVFLLRPGLRTSFWALLPGIVVALGMEVMDLRDDYRSLGHYRWAASLKDVVNTNLLPFLVVCLLRVESGRSRRSR